MRSPLLALPLTAAVASYFVGERSDAVIIGVIVTLSLSLGLVNEYRAEKAAEALHSRHRRTAARSRHRCRAAVIRIADSTSCYGGSHGDSDHVLLLIWLVATIIGFAFKA